MIENKILCACGCGQEISRHDSQGRERKYINHHYKNRYWLNKKMPYEIRQKMSIFQKGRKHTKEHIQKVAIKTSEIKRSEHFAKYGWKTIFINEDEIKSKDENLILNKIQIY